MLLVDTSAWIEWLINSSLSKPISKELPQRDEWLVPTIVQFELVKWCTRELGEARADDVLAYSETCVVANLDSRIARWAAEMAVDHKLATADAIIYATALSHDAELLTCDKHFKGLPQVRFLPKRG